MSEARKHAPGPWIASQHHDSSHWFVEYIQGGERYTLIDEIFHEEDAELIADAPRLKAVNAELLAALQESGAWLDFPSVRDAMYKAGEMTTYHRMQKERRAAIRAALPEGD